MKFIQICLIGLSLNAGFVHAESDVQSLTQNRNADASAAWGNSLPLNSKFTEIYLVEGSLESTGMSSPHCRPHTPCEPRGTVVLKFELEGCADVLGPVQARLERSGNPGKYVLYVNAYAFKNADSARAMCRKNEVLIEVPVGGLGGISKENVESVYNQQNFFYKK